MQGASFGGPPRLCHLLGSTLGLGGGKRGEGGSPPSLWPGGLGNEKEEERSPTVRTAPRLQPGPHHHPSWRPLQAGWLAWRGRAMPWKLDTICPSLVNTFCPDSLDCSVQVPQASQPRQAQCFSLGLEAATSSNCALLCLDACVTISSVQKAQRQVNRKTCCHQGSVQTETFG